MEPSEKGAKNLEKKGLYRGKRPDGRGSGMKMRKKRGEGP